MAGRPYRSKLVPHYEFIRAARLREETWEEIARQLRERGIAADRSQVCKFYKRHTKGKRPAGFAPEPKQVAEPPMPTTLATPEKPPAGIMDEWFPPKPKLTLKVVKSSQNHEQEK